jgi:hypothetical protein
LSRKNGRTSGNNPKSKLARRRAMRRRAALKKRTPRKKAPTVSALPPLKFDEPEAPPSEASDA